MTSTENIIVQNIRMIKVMKSCAYKDAEIAAYLGLPVKDFIDAMMADDYLKEVYEQASLKLASDIEALFLENTLKQLAAGDNTDAKWLLERTNKKYNKTDKLDVTVTTIDDVIRNAGKP